MPLAEMCPCGRPLHYTDPTVERLVRGLIAKLGENVRCVTPSGVFLVSRHYIALHGLNAAIAAKIGVPMSREDRI